jgi:hypothetical protein
MSECLAFNDEHFKDLILKGILKPTGFSFKKVTYSDVLAAIEQLPESSSSGDSTISTKLLKILFCSCMQIAEAITNLFNDCIEQGEIPDKFKIALITPLFKNVGNREDMNNYRGISVLPPIEKAF